jgi:hypothetical protein
MTKSVDNFDERNSVVVIGDESGLYYGLTVLLKALR